MDRRSGTAEPFLTPVGGLLEPLRLGGNLAEYSNESPGLRAIASNIQPKKFRVKLRRDFHLSSSFPDNRTFFGGKDAIQISIHRIVSSTLAAVQVWYISPRLVHILAQG